MKNFIKFAFSGLSGMLLLLSRIPIILGIGCKFMDIGYPIIGMLLIILLFVDLFVSLSYMGFIDYKERIEKILLDIRDEEENRSDILGKLKNLTENKKGMLILSEFLLELITHPNVSCIESWKSTLTNCCSDLEINRLITTLIDKDKNISNLKNRYNCYVYHYNDSLDLPLKFILRLIRCEIKNFELMKVG